MPSSNCSKTDYINALETLECRYDKYTNDGTVLIIGDFNAYVSKDFGTKNHISANRKGILLQSFIQQRQLCSINSQT